MEANMRDPLGTVLSALSDPTRRSIVERLIHGPATPQELATGKTITPQAISHHLTVLEEAGLIWRSREAQSRPCHLDAAGLRLASGWINQYRAIWEGSFDRLAEHLSHSIPRKDKP